MASITLPTFIDRVNSSFDHEKLHEAEDEAEHRPNFRWGSKEFWDISKNMDLDDEEQCDPSKSKKESAGQRITVKKNNW